MRAVKRVLATLSAVAVVSTGLAVVGPAAYAANVNGAVVTVTSGSSTTSGGLTDVFDLNTDGECSAGTNFLVRIFGNGFATAGVNLVGNTALSVAPRNALGGYRIPISQTLETYASQQAPPVVYSGSYRIQFVCRGSLNATVVDDFNAAIAFSSPTAFTVTTAAALTATTTTLTGSPISPVAPGTPVTLTATVVDAASVLGGGSFQFTAGGAPVGAPVTAVAGVATTSVVTTATGGVFAAELRPLRLNTFARSSATVSYAAPVVVGPDLATTTSLQVTPATPTVLDVVTLAAAVSPATATGTVTFKDGATVLGTVPVSSGTASLSRSFAAAGYSFTAQFTPGAGFLTSTSTAVPVTVAPAPVQVAAPAFQDISTTIAAGQLTITVANRSVQLPAPVLNATGALLQTSGSLNAITITDTRAGNPGYSASGQVSDFSSGTGAINGSNLGWSPSVISQGSGQAVVAGNPVEPAPGLAPGQPAPAGVGLKDSPRQLASAVQGKGNGTAVVGALLRLNAPTSTTAGTYTALLTLTAI